MGWAARAKAAGGPPAPEPGPEERVAALARAYRVACRTSPLAAVGVHRALARAMADWVAQQRRAGPPGA